MTEKKPPKSDQQKKSKIKKLSIKVIWLICLLFFMSLAGATTYSIYTKYYVDKTNTEATTPPTHKEEQKELTITTLNQTTNSPSTEETNKILEYKQEIISLKSKNDALETLANSLQNRLDAIKDIDHTFVVNTYLLIEKLKTNSSFEKELNEAIAVTDDILLKDKLQKLKVYSSFGVYTNEQLIDSYKKIFKETYIRYLTNQDDLQSKLKAYFYKIVFIKKNHTDLQNTDDTLSRLINTEVYMKRNDFEKAYNEFMKINMIPSEYTQTWLSNILERIEVQKVLFEIETILKKYIETENK